MQRLFNPLKTEHIPDGSSSDEIFTRTFWCNELGSKAMKNLNNRREAEAMLLFGQTYCPEHFPSLHPLLHTDLMSLFFDKASKLKAVARTSCSL